MPDQRHLPSLYSYSLVGGENEDIGAQRQTGSASAPSTD